MKRFSKALPLIASLSAISFADNTFFINEAGYDNDKPVSIVVQSTDELEGTGWTLWVDPENGSTGASVATGTFGKGVNPDNWAKSGKYYFIDLTKELPTLTTALPTSYSVIESGLYHIEVATGSPSSSKKFYVGQKNLAGKTIGMVMDYFYNDRANKDPILGWDQEVPVYGSSGVTRDVRGGWYDASGDVSKYLSHLSYANYLNPQQIPLTVWSLAHAANRIPSTIKQFSNRSAADEAAYGADFLVRMLDKQGFFYMTVFDTWGMGNRTLCAFSGEDGKKSSNYQTAFREGGGMAIAGLARAAKLGLKGEFTSEQYLEAAEKAFAHLSEKQGIGKACAYCDDGKENIIDDYTALLAATELFEATGKEEYIKTAQERAQSLCNRLSKDGYFWSDDAKTRPFWHASDAGLPLIALIRFAEVESFLLDKENPNRDKHFSLAISTCTDCLGCPCYDLHLQEALETIKKHTQWLISITNKVENPFGYARQTYKTGDKIKDGFFIPHDNESGYWWQGENARLASLAAAVAYAYKAKIVTDSATAADKYITDQLDWVLGKNPYGTCMMNGIGQKNPKEYDGTSEHDATLKGGIANGITGKNKDGSGIAWDDDGVAYVGFDPDEFWHNWRWIEQWLPHTTWFLNALATRYDENPPKVELHNVAIRDKKITVAKGFNVKQQGRTLAINVTGVRTGASVELYSLSGTKITASNLTQGQATLRLDFMPSGIYMVKVEGLGAKKIAVK